MFTEVTWDPARGLGRLDKRVRFYGAVLSGDPERSAMERWELHLFKTFHVAVSRVRFARTDGELWSVGLVVSKRRDGDLAVTWGNTSPLAGWTGAEHWECWGGAVVSRAIWELENDESYALTPGQSWTVWPHESQAGHVRILETHVPTAHWPMRADEGRKPGED